MIDLTDEVLGAFLDNALSADERNAVAAALAADPAARERLDALRAIDDATRAAHPLAPIRLDDPLARRIREARLNAPPKSPLRQPVPAMLSALAAGLVGLVAGQILPMTATRPATGQFAANGALLRALDTQRSGEAVDGVRVLLSFKAQDATPCRQFAVSTRGVSGEGVACRENEAWRVVAWVEAPGGGADDGYRAAGADGVIDTVVDRIDASGALSVDDEAVLIRGHWR